MKKLLPLGILAVFLAAAVILHQQGAGAAPDHRAYFVINQATFTVNGEDRKSVV